VTALVFLLVVLIAAAISTLWVAIVTSVAATMSFNYFFLPPVGTWGIADPQHWVALFVFLAVSLIASNLSARIRARELARQSEVLKSTLLASISHDLRTPLTSIRVAAANLRDTWLGDAERREQADIILTEAERLTRLFQNILSMTRIDAGPVTTSKEWAAPSEVVAAAKEQVEQALRRHRLDVVIDADDPVELDPRLTSTALAHVLENAAQYSPPATHIEVTVQSTDGAVRFTVHDAGPGIPPADLPHVFERFYRGGASNGRASGTGMGLTIARGLLAAQGGEISAANDPRGGAVFTMSVPIRPRAFDPQNDSRPTAP
jgi:two-component system sensor histidine kinase KdpD